MVTSDDDADKWARRAFGVSVLALVLSAYSVYETQQYHVQSTPQLSVSSMTMKLDNHSCISELIFAVDNKGLAGTTVTGSQLEYYPLGPEGDFNGELANNVEDVTKYPIKIAESDEKRLVYRELGSCIELPSPRELDKDSRDSSPNPLRAGLQITLTSPAGTFVDNVDVNKAATQANFVEVQ